ncbi:MAG: hypothetical protein ABI634_18545 [Acidobacteriota bacterium]
MHADVPRLARAVAAATVAVIAVAAGACASRGFTAPQGPSKPATDAARSWREATSKCADLQALQAQARLSGRVGRQRIPGLIVGVIATRANEIGLEARLSGSAAFVLAGRAGEATLVLPQERRVVVASASAILEALVGVAWDPSRLMAVLAGCVAPDADVQSGSEFNDGTLVVNLAGGDLAYVTTLNGRPVVRAARSGGLRVDYRRGTGEWPAEVRIASEPGQVPAVALQLRLETVVLNPVIDPRTFTVTVPAGAEAMSVAQLRDGGPLADASPRP